MALNFAYELRKWGGGHPNITSPEAEYQPHVCTSIVAQDSKNQIFHGRNMDWNLPEDIRNISVQIEFQRGNKTQYIGATYVGYVVSAEASSGRPCCDCHMSVLGLFVTCMSVWYECAPRN